MTPRLLLTLALTTLALASPAIPAPGPALAPFEIWADGFAGPRGLAIDADDRLWVADREAGTVTRVETDGGQVIVARHLERPVGLAIDAEGRVLVAEERGGRVVRLDPQGPTPLATGLARPRWLAVSEDGTVYVSARRGRPETIPPVDDETAEPQMILALAPGGTLSVFADGFVGLQGLAVRDGAVYAAAAGLRDGGTDGLVYRIPVLAEGRAGAPEPLAARSGRRRPMALAIDLLDAVYVTLRPAGPEGGRRAIVKLHPDGGTTLFAVLPGQPHGLALDGSGHLYVADAGAGRVLRFLAPAAPTLAPLPAFTNQAAVVLEGSTLPGARLDVLLGPDLPPLTTLASGAGTFVLTLIPTANAELAGAVLASAAAGDGLTSAPSAVTLVHDAIAPVALLRTPDAGAFLRGRVVLEAEAADAGSHLASVTLTAAGRPLEAALMPSAPALAIVATAAWSTPEVDDGTHVVAVTALDRAGNATTLRRSVVVDNTAPETEITAGTVTSSSATFAFAGADNLTPVAGLEFAWRLDGGAWSAFTASTTASFSGLAPGLHLVEVVARDAAGNTDPTPAGQQFAVVTPPALRVAITEPAPDATVSAGSVLVRGTLESATGGARVVVNGVAALLHASDWALELPVTPGHHPVTAVATDASGAEATASLTLRVGSEEPPLLLRAEPAEGLAPLTVTWRLVNRASRPLVRIELDPTGRAGWGPPATALDGHQTIYATAGLQLPAVRATDDQGTVLVARTLVHVEEAGTASTRFGQLWTDFKARLLAGDETGALAYLTPALALRLQPVLRQLGADLPAVGASLGEIELIDTVGDLAEAALVQLESGAPFLYFVYFRRDDRGRWLIQEM